MSFSDDDFDDDDDAFLLALPLNKPAVKSPVALSNKNHGLQNTSTGRKATSDPDSPTNPAANSEGTGSIITTNLIHSKAPASTNSDASSDIQNKLYRADGEIAILRQKYQEIQHLRQQEISKFKETQRQIELSNEEQVKSLKFTVQKLEDEKKFMANEIKSLSSPFQILSTQTKRRKTGSPGGQVPSSIKYQHQNQHSTITSTPGHVVPSSLASSSGPSLGRSELSMHKNFSPLSQSTGVNQNERSSINTQQNITMISNGSNVSNNSSNSSNSVTYKTWPRPAQKIIRIQNDSFLLTEHILQYCINGFKRTTMDLLGKIYIDREIEGTVDFKIHKKRPISDAVVDFLMLKKNLRLDELVSEFTESLAEIILNLLGIEDEDSMIDDNDHDNNNFTKGNILPVPFLLALIHCTLCYKPAAVTEKTVRILLKHITVVALQYLFLLDSVENQEEVYSTIYHNEPRQVVILEKFTIICSLDILEQLVALSTNFGREFVNEVYKTLIPKNLIKKCLPENSERFKTTSQINLVYNFVEIIANTVGENLITCSRDHLNSIFSSMLKIFLIDIPLLDDFMFHGLNRIIGNNYDLEKVEATVPTEETELGNVFVSIPCPIPVELAKSVTRGITMNLLDSSKLGHIPDSTLVTTFPSPLSNSGTSTPTTTSSTASSSLSVKSSPFQLMAKHEIHLLNLRVRVAQFIENFLLCSEGDTKSLSTRDHIKSIVRVIGLEQLSILKSPRSRNVHLRGVIIATLIRILHYIVQDSKGISTLVYPETIYEIFVYLLKIAFGSTSLSSEATKLLSQIRAENPNITVFNKYCENRARYLNHIEHCQVGSILTDTESQFANGLEFPYEEETIELAREILDLCVTHDEADNLYFNISST